MDKLGEDLTIFIGLFLLGVDIYGPLGVLRFLLGLTLSTLLGFTLALFFFKGDRTA